MSKTMTKRRSRRSKLDAHVHLVGRIPDREVAAMAGISPDGVRMYRQRHKIPAYSTYKRSLKAPTRAPTQPRVVTGELHAFQVVVGGRVCVVVAPDVVAAARRVSERGIGTVARIENLGSVLSPPPTTAG